MRTTSSILFAAACLCATSANAGTIDLVTNGNFEGGNSAAWTNSSVPFSATGGSCNGGWSVQSTATGCTTGINPAFGSLAAYSSTSFPALTNAVGEWDNYFRQTIVVPIGTITSAILSWQDSIVWSGSGSFRGVDLYALVQNGASSYTISNPSTNGSLPWTARSIDVTSLLQASQGQTLTITFGALTFFDTRTGNSPSIATSAIYGLDNVALNVTTTGAATPEPATVGLTGAALLACGLYRRRNTRNV